ncbi:hypothetical protein [Erythrobacter colymbi]|uniref:hypothetical protein n=1 Tax=Erythrobacter colymbi TaxID=1161202 RepID=UPI000A3CA62A|nr:hypothetical protein [Erythrobacter colymbi]
MGIDDRDYMKERYWERQGKKSPSRWSFNKAEREAARKADEVPPGGATWVGKNTSFDQYDRIAAAGFSRKRNEPRGQHGRRISRQPRQNVSSGTRRFAAWAIPLLCLATYAIPMLGDLRRGGWLPDTEPGLPFPETGSVSVASDLPMKIVRSQLAVRTSDSNAVVQLVHPETDRHVISVFVAANSEVTIPAPVGIWRMRVIEGQKWHGNAKFFGPNTQYETVAELMEFGHSRGNGIDLHRRIDGNLKTRQMLVGPEPL